MDVTSIRICRIFIVIILAVMLAFMYLSEQTTISYNISGVTEKSYERLLGVIVHNDSKVLNDRSIHATERYMREFDIGGSMFAESGRYLHISEIVKSCLIHSFSPYVEQEAAKRFLDPARDNSFFCQQSRYNVA